MIALDASVDAVKIQEKWNSLNSTLQIEKHNITQIIDETQAEFLESVQERILALDEQFKTLTETLPADSKEMKEIEATDALR